MYQFFQDERGTAAIEYALLISLIGLVIAVVLQAVGANLFEVFSTVIGGLTPVSMIEDPRNVRL